MTQCVFCRLQNFGLIIVADKSHRRSSNINYSSIQERCVVCVLFQFSILSLLMKCDVLKHGSAALEANLFAMQKKRFQETNKRTTTTTTTTADIEKGRDIFQMSHITLESKNEPQAASMEQQEASSKQRHSKRQHPTKIIIIKYFEESDKYAKIIPKTAVHILKRRNRMSMGKNDNVSQQITHEQVKQLTHITGKDIISLIKSDQSDWLQQYNPIQAVMLFNQNQNKFIQVTPGMQFVISNIENVFTFHVKRKIKVERLIGQR